MSSALGIFLVGDFDADLVWTGREVVAYNLCALNSAPGRVKPAVAGSFLSIVDAYQGLAHWAMDAPEADKQYLTRKLKFNGASGLTTLPGRERLTRTVGGAQ